jgi:hypothetical protein
MPISHNIFITGNSSVVPDTSIDLLLLVIMKETLVMTNLFSSNFSLYLQM